MPETDILNPTRGWDTTLGDSMNPSYGFTRKRTMTLLHKKAVGGTPWVREIENTGHVFPLSWLGRTWGCVQRLKWYYEQYQDGYFTLIDWEGGGRHYVGRFTTEPQEVRVANNKFDVENLTFEEMPRVPMVQYPTDWDHEAILFNVTNNFGDQKLATSGAWTQTALTAAPQITLGGTLRTTLPATVMTNPGNAGEWAAYEYRGYGFQLFLAKGPEYGQADLYFDDVLVQTIDCYNVAEVGAQIAYSAPSTSLDIHRVRIQCDGTKNASSSGTEISWYALQVMR